MTKLEFDTYLNLCTQVYDLSKPKPPEDAYAFYRSYALEAKGPILEPMCGTGRFLLPLLKEGFEIHGFDASDHMLEALSIKAQRQSLKPKVWKGFVEDLHPSFSYDLIFIPSGSFGLIVDINTVSTALRIFHDQLNEGGVLVLEIITIHEQPKQTKVWTGDAWSMEDGRFIVLSTLDLPASDNISRTIAKYELVEGNKIIQTEIEDYRVRLYEAEAMRKILLDAGFKTIKLLKVFDRSNSPDVNDETIVFECIK